MPGVRNYVREILSESKFGQDAEEQFQDRMETLTTSQLEIIVSYFEGNLDCNTETWRSANQIAYASAKKELDHRKSIEAEGEEEEILERELAIEAAHEAVLDERHERDVVEHMSRMARIEAEREVREMVSKEEQEKKKAMRQRMRQTAARRKRYYTVGVIIFGCGLIITLSLNSTRPISASIIFTLGVLLGGGVILLGYMRTRVLPVDVSEERIEQRIENRAVALLAEKQYEHKRKMDHAKKEERRREAREEEAKLERRLQKQQTRNARARSVSSNMPDDVSDISSNSQWPAAEPGMQRLQKNRTRYTLEKEDSKASEKYHPYSSQSSDVEEDARGLSGERKNKSNERRRSMKGDDSVAVTDKNQKQRNSNSLSKVVVATDDIHLADAKS